MYYTYILRCCDRSLYTGIAKDIGKRMSEHFSRSGQCAKYTRSRRAVKLEAVWESADRSAASRLEYRIKQLKKTVKQRLIDSNEMDVLKDTDAAFYRRLTDEEIGELY